MKVDLAESFVSTTKMSRAKAERFTPSCQIQPVTEVCRRLLVPTEYNELGLSARGVLTYLRFGI